MIWKNTPETNDMDCNFVLKQNAIDLLDSSQLLYWPRTCMIDMPSGLTVVGDWLLVTDTASSRSLSWHSDDLKTGTDAHALTGQLSFYDKGDNRCPLCTDSVCWPYGIQSMGNILEVADSGNNRVSLWKFAV